jgi:homocysteine S-methyltransferase
LDGGLATRLEVLGYDLEDDLWSAKVLLEDSQALRRVHTEFLRAGADCITAGTYQASIQGFEAHGLTRDHAVRVLEQAVHLAVEARDTFWGDPTAHAQRLRPLVAASVGPYGAYRADGAEYTGAYDLSDDELLDFHEVRWRTLAASPADVLGCETIPSRQEAEVLLELLQRTPDRWAWMSFTCRDPAHLSDGSPLAAAARICDEAPRLAAVGINCTCPEYISQLVSVIREATDKPIIVYPNAGGGYDAERKTWEGDATDHDWPALAATWRDQGASVIGGCCRVSPADISSIRTRLVGPDLP